LLLFNGTPPTDTYNLSLHDALPICGQEQIVLVAESAAKAAGRLQEAQAAEDLGAVVGGVVPEQVAAEGRQAAAVAEQVADGQLAGGVGVVELEPRQVLGDGVVPLDLALIHEDGDSRGGKCLGAGGDAEEG